MRFLSKIIAFSFSSKVLILIILIVSFPNLFNLISIHNTDKKLFEKKDKVFKLIQREGIEDYIDNENKSYGSYNIFKEEYISLELIKDTINFTTIENSKRQVEEEVLDFRVISNSFHLNGHCYLLEIGKSIVVMKELQYLLQKYTFYLLLLLVILTTSIEIIFTRFLLKPFHKIIKEKLSVTTHPYMFTPSLINTSTTDFIALDESINGMMERIKNSFEREKEFISNVSHELLTPVSIIQNKLENLLNSPELTEISSLKVVESLKTVNRFKNIIKNLMFISKIENEQFLKNEEISVTQLLTEVYEEVKDRAEMKSITIEMDIKETLLMNNINKSLFFVLVLNIVMNAIKYNKEFGIVYIQLLKENMIYILKIRDTGCGISQDKLAHVFDRFKRFNVESAEGSGLGLSIVKSIADFHNIEIKIWSELGKGSEFRLILPMQK